VVAEHVTLYKLLAQLCEQQKRAWFTPVKDAGLDPKALNAYQQLIGAWGPLQAEEVDAKLRSKSALDLRASRQAVYLPPASKLAHFTPLLVVKCCADQTGAALQLRLMLISCADDCRLHGLGYRMEIGTEEHAFPHAQLIRDFFTSPQAENSPLVDCPAWLPQTQPSFPIPATDSVTLLLTMLMSLYGLDFTKYFDPTAVPGIKSYVDHVIQILRPPK